MRLEFACANPKLTSNNLTSIDPNKKIGLHLIKATRIALTWINCGHLMQAQAHKMHLHFAL